MRHHSWKYTINESFFDKWSAKMAYVLGFWFADGYMRVEKSYRISVTSNDLEILQQIRSALGSSHPIRPRRDENAFDMVVHSKRLYERLVQLGGFRRKSRTVVFPVVPKEYLRDFIRGYFDGDGSVFRVKYLRTKDNKLAVELRSNFTSGSIKFLKQLMLVLRRELGLEKKVLGRYNDGHSLKLGYGTGDTRRLLKYMYYSGFPIGLQRKAKFLYT